MGREAGFEPATYGLKGKVIAVAILSSMNEYVALPIELLSQYEHYITCSSYVNFGAGKWT